MNSSNYSISMSDDTPNYKNNENNEEELWKIFHIKFNQSLANFPDNKFYATIDIQPESARKLIKNFSLIVNDLKRCEFDNYYKTISASGFDVSKDNKINVKIQANPLNNKLKSTKKESKSCCFTFNGKTTRIISMLTFVPCDKNKNVNENINAYIKWYDIGNNRIHKYVVLLDKKEVQYINKDFIFPEMEICVHDLVKDSKHTVEIKALDENRNTIYQSDLINFTVPLEKPQETSEVISVHNEKIPNNLLIINEIDENPQSSRNDKFREKSLELLRSIEDQIMKVK